MGVINGGIPTTPANLHHRKPSISLPPPPLVSDQNSPSVLAVSSSGPALEVLNVALSEGSGPPVRCDGDSVALPGEEFEWVTVDRGEDNVVMGDDALRVHEIQEAFSALHLMLRNVDTKADAEHQVLLSEDTTGLSDWTEPPLQQQPYMQARLFDAFHLLQTDPSIQRIVISLASDKAVCDAVMNNRVVRELITDVHYDLERSDESPEDSGSGSAVDIIKRLFERSATKIMGAMETITKHVIYLFKTPEDEAVVVTVAAPLMEKLQMTVLLAVVVLLIVSVTRAMA